MRTVKDQISAGLVLHEVSRLLRPFWPLVAFATGIGILIGLATVWLLATINTGLHEGGETWSLLAPSVFASSASAERPPPASATASWGRRSSPTSARIFRLVSLRAPIAALETHRFYRLISVLTCDVDTVSAFTFSSSGYAITIGSFVYRFTLSPAVLYGTSLTVTLFCFSKGAESESVVQTGGFGCEQEFHCGQILMLKVFDVWLARASMRLRGVDCWRSLSSMTEVRAWMLHGWAMSLVRSCGIGSCDSIRMDLMA